MGTKVLLFHGEELSTYSSHTDMVEVKAEQNVKLALYASQVQ